ncbi:MAG TPA: hypothetical protein DDX19_04390 [Rhodopirellula baltica]|nr:hypothetical protein [Rhodopirellula baltica]
MADKTFIWVVFYKKPIAPTGFTTCIHKPFTIPTHSLRIHTVAKAAFLMNSPAIRLTKLIESKPRARESSPRLHTHF